MIIFISFTLPGGSVRKALLKLLNTLFSFCPDWRFHQHWALPVWKFPPLFGICIVSIIYSFWEFPETLRVTCHKSHRRLSGRDDIWTLIFCQSPVFVLRCLLAMFSRWCHGKNAEFWVRGPRYKFWLCNMLPIYEPFKNICIVWGINLNSTWKLKWYSA